MVVPDMVGIMYSGVVTGVVAGLILSLSQRILKKLNAKYFWVEMLINIFLLIVFAIYLTCIYK